MSTHDTNGREYAKLNDLKPGDWIEVDSGFICMDAGAKLKVQSDYNLYIPCSCGKHFLDGQDDGDGYLVGIYKVG